MSKEIDFGALEDIRKKLLAYDIPESELPSYVGNRNNGQIQIIDGQVTAVGATKDIKTGIVFALFQALRPRHKKGDFPIHKLVRYTSGPSIMVFAIINGTHVVLREVWLVGHGVRASLPRQIVTTLEQPERVLFTEKNVPGLRSISKINTVLWLMEPHEQDNGNGPHKNSGCLVNLTLKDSVKIGDLEKELNKRVPKQSELIRNHVIPIEVFAAIMESYRPGRQKFSKGWMNHGMDRQLWFESQDTILDSVGMKPKPWNELKEILESFEASL